MREEVSIGEILTNLKDKLSLLIAMSLVGLLAVTIYTFFIVTPTYESITQLLVNHRAEEGTGIQLNDINTNVRMIDTYKDIIKGPVILDEVKNNLNTDFTAGQLSNMIKITANANSQVFSITINSEDPVEASEIANEIATTFQEKISDIMHVENVSVISKASIKTSPVSPNIPLNLIVGLLLGLLLGVGVALLQSYLDNTIKGSKFLTEAVGWPDLGAISDFSSEDMKAISEYAGTSKSASRKSRVK